MIDVTLLRQPILDAQMTIIGYELMLHPLEGSSQVAMKSFAQLHKTYDLNQLSGGALLFHRSRSIGRAAAKHAQITKNPAPRGHSTVFK